MIGEKLSPVLSEIEDLLIEHEAMNGNKPNFTDDGFRAGVKIFISVLMDKMWEYQKRMNIQMDERIILAELCGNDVRSLVKRFTGIDTHDLYNN